MTGGLTSSCLQQRETAGYPYMFHDPLHSLSSSYNSRAACNPAVAHAQPTTHPSYATGGSAGGTPVSTGTGKCFSDNFMGKIVVIGQNKQILACCFFLPITNYHLPKCYPVVLL